MAQAQHLSRAPITEAVIDIQVRFDQQRRPEEFEGFGDAVASEYPRKETRQSFLFQLNIGQASVADQSSGVFGFLFRNLENTQVVQSKPEGFAFSRLQPYQDWDSMSAEAWRLWLLYRQRYSPSKVWRLSVRYINSLRLPEPPLDFDDYLTIAPRLPVGADSVGSFTSGLVLPNSRTRTTAILRTVFEPLPDPRSLTVILDIDVVREVDYDAHSDLDIRSALQELRGVKNDMFFGSLTDRAVELFK